ncbi:MAG: hypothetical protein MUO67_06160, partial [Anaerolineales bacterium]|nr:hypothetical protein [Anaerolineales bacterium]
THSGNVIALVPHLLRGLLPLPRGADERSEEESLQLYLFPVTPIIRPNSRFRDSSHPGVRNDKHRQCHCASPAFTAGFTPAPSRG